MSKFYVVLAILTSIFIYWWLGVSNEPKTMEIGKTSTMEMFGEITEFDAEETPTYELKENRAHSIDYKWVKMQIENECYPTIKEDLKQGLEKFGYFHKETDKIITKKCREKLKVNEEKGLNKQDRELMELVK